MSRAIEHRRRSAILRGLKIVVAVTCLTACVLLVALWVRSYWKHDAMVVYQGSRIGSEYGTVYFYRHPPLVPNTGRNFGFGTLPSPSRKPTFMFECKLTANDTRIRAPHWYIAPLFAALAASPWLPWSKRFSLRTLPIATALVAFVLAIVYALR
jgi:hypothetical protein